MSVRIGIDVDNGDMIDVKGVETNTLQRVSTAIPRLSEEYPDVEFILSGNQENILSTINPLPSNFIILSSTNDYSEYKHKALTRPVKGTSLNNLVTAMKADDENRIDGFVSIADTSKLGVELLRLKRLSNVKKPTLVAHIPSTEGIYMLSDAGANTLRSNKTEYGAAVEAMAFEVYTQGLMTVSYARTFFNMQRPRLGLLSNGTEDHKGTDLIDMTEQMFNEAIAKRGLESITDFVGKVEPDDGYFGNVDILLTDGFTGNIYLKASEAAAKFLIKMGKDALKRFTALDKLRLAPGVGVLKKAKGNLMDIVNPFKYAGAPLLGYSGAVVKGHGISNTEAIYYSVVRTIEYVKKDCNRHIVQTLQKYS